MRLPVMPPVSPMLAKLLDEIPTGKFLYEPKWDGFRSIVFRDGDEVEIGSRNERPMARYFPEVVEAVRANVAERRRALEKALRKARTPIHLTPATTDRELALRWFDEFEGAGLDGVVAKPLDLTYQPDKRAMFKIKHVRTADCVVAGYRVHKSEKDAIGSLLLGLYDAEGELQNVGVVGAFPMAQRRRLFRELQPLVTTFDEHPWDWAKLVSEVRTPRHSEFSRWAAGKDLSFVPLRPERVIEVRYDHMEGPRFRHTAQFVRWRPDRDPRSCTFDQLEEPVSYDLGAVLGGG